MASRKKPRQREFTPPLTVSHPAMLVGGNDELFREALYLMVLAFGRLLTCREAFGRTIALTGSQFAVLIGTAYREQCRRRVDPRARRPRAACAHPRHHRGREADPQGAPQQARQRARPARRPGPASPRRRDGAPELAPFLRRVNDLLLPNISRSEFNTVARFLCDVRAEHRICGGRIRRSERERADVFRRSGCRFAVRKCDH